MHIALNAHLLSRRAGYRSAGIHQYMANTLAGLAAAAPAGWQFTAHVGAQIAADEGTPSAAEASTLFPGVAVCLSRFTTESALRRIAWEQAVGPFALGRADLVHAMAFVAPLLLARPFVVTVYDLSFIHTPERMPASRRVYLRAFTGETCRRARRVIAISAHTARDVAEQFAIAPEKIDVAAPGCDHARFRPLPAADVAAFRAAHGLPERFWLFIGTLEPRKNLVFLLEAYAALAPDMRLPLILAGGRGWDDAPIFAAVERLGLRAWVRFPGFLSPDDLPLWYNSAEAFVYPSLYEGFGLPALEAMACGTPVLVSNASALPEVVGTAGWALPAEGAAGREAWTDALARIGGDAHARSDLRTRGLAQAARFTWEATAQATIASYRRAL
jgi:glycosyltransferase involved in cell wall biosynthesis